MSLVEPIDKDSKGMFSKPGLFTTKKYIILAKKEEILTNKRKFLKTTFLKDPWKEKNEEDQKEEEDFPEEKKVADKKVIVNKRKKDETEPFAKNLKQKRIPVSYFLYHGNSNHNKRVPKAMHRPLDTINESSGSQKSKNWIFSKINPKRKSKFEEEKMKLMQQKSKAIEKAKTASNFFNEKSPPTEEELYRYSLRFHY